MHNSSRELVPQLDEQTRWRIGICSVGEKSAGSAFLMRRLGDWILVELEVPAPVPNSPDDDVFVLAPDGAELLEMVAQLRPLWLPVGHLSVLAYKRHFPNGLPIEDL